ncbi:MAG: hypothetical protein HKN00_11780 [Flavobacteriaceae bacterium]|nr:hypothetical protein [Bacteroidia bacterium]MBT8288036.1 hypothetical protein [Bacteroidia bacterium]NNF75858.1 hypothetical protein [Flavobacteriaceae bacterium]NNK73083.1 hypothetical protein [Flavobacteriaceae bacterium]
MELYKSRDFSAFFQDTFAFIKQYGRHFFKHFFIVNGIFVLILMVFGYFFMSFYTDIVFSGLMQNNPNAIDDFMNENSVLFLILFILFVIISIVFGVFMYAYPVFYLKLYQKNSDINFGTSELIQAYKVNLGRLFVYIICSILIGIPLILVFGAVIFVMFITIIGILAIPFAIGALSLFYFMALLEYMEGRMSIWDAFGYSWKLLSSKFLAAVASVGLFYLMSYVIQNVITVIAYIFGMVRMFTTVGDDGSNSEAIGGMMSMVMIISFIATFLLGTILNNLVLLNQGIIFYSLKEEAEKINTKDIIDQIGSVE